MSALQRIFGRDTKFFDLLEAGATAAKQSASLLVALLAKLTENPASELLAELAQARRKHKRISQETTEQLCKIFVTPLEREDIEALVLPFLTKAGIKEVDAVFISHAHYDHFGGLLWLKDHFPIKKLIDSGFVFQGDAPAAYVQELDDYNRLRDAFKQRGAYQEAHTGDPLELDPMLQAEVTAPPRDFFTKAYPELRAANDPPAHYLVNANSLGIRIVHGKKIFLLPGDIQAEDQVFSLLPSLPIGKFKCDVLVAPGHGLHSPRQFAEATRPDITLCSVFPRYAGGLSARKIYAAVGSKVYVTGLQGQLRVTSDGENVTVETEREMPTATK